MKKQLKIDLKLLTIMDLIHKQKLRVLDNKEILYSNLHDIYTRVELVYETLKENETKYESHNINGKFIEPTIKGEGSNRR